MNYRQPGRAQATRATAFAVMLGVLLNSFMLAGRCVATPTNKDGATVIAPATGEATDTTARDAVAKRPLLFEANNGQSDAAVRFIARADHYTIFLTPTEAVMALSAVSTENAPAARQEASTEALRMRLLGANARPDVEGLEPVAAGNNYFIGHDASRWQASVANFTKVNYANVYPGINLIYYGNQRELEYDFNVAVGADPAAIRLAFDGAERLSIDGQGNLVIETAAGRLTQHKPVAYQMVNGARQEVACQYRLTTDKTGAAPVASFEPGDYDRARELVIDPVVAYSTYLGGSKDDRADGVAVDDEGNIYITGRTPSANFPIFDGLQPHKTAPATDYEDIFVSKLDPSGTQLLYSTYLGGSQADYGTAIGLDDQGNIYVAGITYSPDFPLANAMRSTFGGKSEGFVVKLNAAGSALVYSTYIGGQDEDALYGLAVDPTGGVWVGGTTNSTDFPLFAPVQVSSGGDSDGVVAKLNAQGTAFEFATYFGGSGLDYVESLTLDSAGAVYITGGTTSTDLPLKNPVQAVYGGMNDAFVAKLNPESSALVYSTYLGGSQYDDGSHITVDGKGNAYVVGGTGSKNFPTAAALQPVKAGDSDGFVTRLNPAGNALLFSTYLGGNQTDTLTGCALDAAGNLCLAGYTLVVNSSVVDVAPAAPTGNYDCLVAKIDAKGTGIIFSGVFGGNKNENVYAMTTNKAGDIYVAGQTDSLSGLTTANSFQPLAGGGYDAFVTRVTGFASVALQISDVHIQGKQLIVNGANFDETSKIYVNGVLQKKVFQDEQSPKTVLIAKKAGKAIAQGQTVSVQVRNGQGKVSNEFMYTRPINQAAGEWH